jgi:hypothetical protein
MRLRWATLAKAMAVVWRYGAIRAYRYRRKASETCPEPLSERPD